MWLTLSQKQPGQSVVKAYADMLLVLHPYHLTAWQSFLSVDFNKLELFGFLLKALIASFNYERQELIVTDGDQDVCVPAHQDVHLYLHYAVTERLTKEWFLM